MYACMYAMLCYDIARRRGVHLRLRKCVLGSLAFDGARGFDVCFDCNEPS